MRDGTPLPANLSGNIVQRLIEIDEALLYLINGALVYLVDKEPLEQTGTLTPENARNALSEMFYVYLDESVTIMPVGSIIMWTMATIPDRWLICDGAAYLKSEYPELYALFGGKYGENPTFFGVPDMTFRSPFGASISTELDVEQGEMEHTLTVDEIPSHRHTQRIGTGGGTNALAVGTTNNANATATRDNLNDTGGGGSHNNLHPVYGVYYIVYAGK